MSYIPEEPPDENEAYENLDESLDELDLPGHGGGPEGGRDVEDLVVDREALRELGADLDDPERIALLDGGMDDPDGVELPRRSPSSMSMRLRWIRCPTMSRAPCSRPRRLLSRRPCGWRRVCDL
jgi:hypothetical protein